MNIGSKVNEARTKQELTIRNLADMTGLSIGFISNLERDQTSPTISNLQLICTALNINLLDLMKEASEEQKVIVTKRSKRKTFFPNDNGVRYEALNKFDRANALAIIMDQETLFCELDWDHASDEIGVVIEGSLELIIDEKNYILEKGDSIFISKGARHNYRNPTNEKSVTYWFFMS